MRVMATNSWCVVLVLLCLYNLISFSQAHNNGFSVEIIHRDSPRSPLYRSMETKFERVANAVRRSINRAHHLRKYSISPNTAEAPVVAGQGEYLMIYSVGTPPFQLYGIIDTGSNIVWLQCQPCEQCYNQTTPIFDPSKSKSYKTLPCTSTTCQSVAGNSCDQNCEYSISYGDGSVSQGDLSVDTLTLGSTSGSSVQFPRTVLGCGHKNTGLFQGKTSGIVGLSGGPVSLITQLSSSIAGKFSYCLAPLFTESDSSSKLNFGDAAVVSGAGTVSTPIVPQADHIFYFLTLEALSVGNNRIEFGNSSSSDGEGNIIIDSGTTLTVLPDDMYSNLESAVADAVKLERVDDPNQQLSLCFKSTSDEPDVPVITAHFTGADVQLNPVNTFIQVADEIICLAFQASEDQAIFGNLAQQNLLVGYDLQKNTLSFKPTDCTKQ
ncbi:hypothetical protein Fmac_025484 [Flemingia macrophylla]|uniref:Peptidase A1 domain-containing protein n=1 Tax=Flemingia macrophylla TaxID=520843 RepID=A0ABD1LSC1_9FABA